MLACGTARVKGCSHWVDSGGWAPRQSTGVRARPVIAHLRGSHRAACGCRGDLRLGEQARALSASSTRRPRYMTPISSVTDMAHHGQVVRDEQIGQALLALQVLHDVEHLGLDGHVQRRRGLVADQELGLRGERARDGDALALAAGELVRVAALVSAGFRARRVSSGQLDIGVGLGLGIDLHQAVDAQGASADDVQRPSHAGVERLA